MAARDTPALQSDFLEPAVKYPPKSSTADCDRLKPRYPDLSDAESGALRRIYAMVNDPARRTAGGKLADLDALGDYLRRSSPADAGAVLKIVALSGAAAAEMVHADQRNALWEASRIQHEGLQLLRRLLAPGSTGLSARLVSLFGPRLYGKLLAADVRDILINWLHSLPYLTATLTFDRMRDDLELIGSRLTSAEPALSLEQQQDVVEKMLLIGHCVPHAFDVANRWIAQAVSPPCAPQSRGRLSLVRTYVSQLPDLPQHLQNAALKFVCDLAPYLEAREKDALDREIGAVQEQVSPRAQSTLAAARAVLAYNVPPAILRPGREWRITEETREEPSLQVNARRMPG